MSRIMTMTHDEVAPGLFRVVLPLPFSLDHVNIYCLKEADGWTVIDTGLGDGPTRDNWRTLLDTLLAGEPIVRIVVTHFHPDHVGLASWLGAQFPAAFHMTRTEWLVSQMLSCRENVALCNAGTAFYAAAGCPEPVARECVQRMTGYADMISGVPGSYHRLEDGAEIVLGNRRWRIMTGSGHAPEQACLYCQADNLFIAGDFVLPGITPNISVFQPEPDSNPLRDFLHSMQSFRGIPDDCLIMPGHGAPFKGLCHRMDQLQTHHIERLAQIEAICRDAISGYGVMQAVFRRDLDRHQTVFALGEAIAHLNYLQQAGRIVRHIDENGTRLFRTPDCL